MKVVDKKREPCDTVPTLACSAIYSKALISCQRFKSKEPHSELAKEALRRKVHRMCFPLLCIAKSLHVSRKVFRLLEERGSGEGEMKALSERIYSVTKCNQVVTIEQTISTTIEV